MSTDTPTASPTPPTSPAPITFATPLPELMRAIADSAQRRAHERAETETWGMDHDPEQRWSNPEAQRAWIAVLAAATAHAGEDEVTLTSSAPGAARHAHNLAECLDSAAGTVIVGFPCGEIDLPRAGTARYRLRPTPDRLLTDEPQFCATCAVIIANGDTSGDGAEHAAEQIERRWRDSGGHLVVSGGPDDHEPAWTVFDCDGCGNPTAAHPVPGVLLRA